MTVGISTTNVANEVLDWLRGVAPASVAGLHVQLHTGDPGGAGTSATSVVTSREQATMNAASGGSITLSSMSGAWSMTATETISHISICDATSAGNFLMSAALTSSVNVASGDTVTLITLTISNSPLAA